MEDDFFLKSFLRPSKSLPFTITVVFLFLLGAVSNLSQLIGIPTSIGAWLLIVLIITSLLWGIFNQRTTLFPMMRLTDREAVLSTIQDVIATSNKVVFIGKFEPELFQLLWTNYQIRLKTTKKLNIDIYNYDSHIYFDRQHQNVATQLVEWDSSEDPVNHWCLANTQIVNLVIGKSRHHQRFITYFDSPDGGINGILVNRGVALSDDAISGMGFSCRVNMLEQGKELHGTIFDMRRFWEPLKKGWIHPVFPPTNSKEVRKEWRKAILEWFNEKALHFLSGGGKITITWKITEHSLTDAKAFTEWIEWQKNSVYIEVERYLLIDKAKCRQNATYREIVNEILNTYFPLSGNDRYKYYFINSTSLDSYLCEDFALFTLPDGRILAQDAERMESAMMKLFESILPKPFQLFQKIAIDSKH